MPCSYQYGEGLFLTFSGQTTDDLLVILRSIKQRHTQTDFLKQRPHLVDVLAERLHLDTVNDIGRLDYHVRKTFRFQLGQCLHGIQFAHSALGQPAHDDA